MDVVVRVIWRWGRWRDGMRSKSIWSLRCGGPTGMNGLGGNAGSGTIGTLGVVDVQGEWFGWLRGSC